MRGPKPQKPPKRPKASRRPPAVSGGGTSAFASGGPAPRGKARPQRRADKRHRGLDTSGLHPRQDAKVARKKAVSASRTSAKAPIGGMRLAFGVAVSAALVALVALVTIVVLAQTPAFTIREVDAQASEHVSAESIVKLAGVQDGTTLLNVDASEVVQNVRRNPWIKDVQISRQFPDRLGITVTERKVAALVTVGSSGSGVWALGDDRVWIEPVGLSVPADADLTTVALAKAKEMGCLLITQVPASVDPTQGAKVTDDTIEAALSYQEQFSDGLASQVAMYSAPSTGSVSCVLQSGVEISLGSPTDVSSKEAAIQELLSKYSGQLTYLNVRVPSKPAYRKLDGEVPVTAGSGTTSQTASATTTAATTSAATGDVTGEATTDSAEDKEQ